VCQAAESPSSDSSGSLRHRTNKKHVEESIGQEDEKVKMTWTEIEKLKIV